MPSRKTPKKTSKRVVLYVPDTFDPDVHLPGTGTWRLRPVSPSPDQCG